jgi:hypothetical protein
MAIDAPTRESTELAAELIDLLKQLPADERALYVESISAAAKEALETDGYRKFADVLQGWQHLVLARRDPNYEKNMARGNEPLGQTFTVEEIKQRFQAPPAG